jgi:hypothetical protein
MSLQRAVLVAGGLLAATAVSVAAAQEDRMLRPPAQAEAIIYRDAGYKGPAVNVSQAQPDLGLAFRINSVRVNRGEWQLCERPNYGGNCRVIDKDTALLGLRGIEVQSMRPLGWGGGGGGGGQLPLEPGRNPNLRGMAAQFYAAPAARGYRVQACEYGSANQSCARRTADRFCADMGWRSAARHALETVRGRVYLADVLCSNTGN